MSKRFTLNTTDLLAILKVLAWSGLSAIITATLLVIEDVDFAQYALFVPVINTLLYTAKAFVDGQKGVE